MPNLIGHPCHADSAAAERQGISGAKTHNHTNVRPGSGTDRLHGVAKGAFKKLLVLAVADLQIADAWFNRLTGLERSDFAQYRYDGNNATIEAPMHQG